MKSGQTGSEFRETQTSIRLNLYLLSSAASPPLHMTEDRWRTDGGQKNIDMTREKLSSAEKKNR